MRSVMKPTHTDTPAMVAIAFSGGDCTPSYRVVAKLLFLLTTWTMVAVPKLLGQERKPAPFLSGEDVMSAAFLDNDLIATSTSKGEIHVRSVKSGVLSKRFRLTTEQIYGLLTIERSSKIIGIAGTTRVIVFDLRSEKEIATIQSPSSIIQIAVTPDCKKIIAACADGSVRLYDIATRKLIGAVMPVLGVRGPRAMDVAVSPNGRYIAASYSRVDDSVDDHVYIWDAKTLHQVGSYKVKASFAGSVSFHPKEPNTLIVPGPDDRSISTWDIANNKEASILA